MPVNAICTLETIPICCVHGDEKPYPTADIYIEVQDQAYLLNVGVADTLPFPVVLGHDLPVLFDLLNPGRSCNVAVTRAQAKRAEAEPSVPCLSLGWSWRLSLGSLVSPIVIGSRTYSGTLL